MLARGVRRKDKKKKNMTNTKSQSEAESGVGYRVTPNAIVDCRYCRGVDTDYMHYWWWYHDYHDTATTIRDG